MNTLICAHTHVCIDKLLVSSTVHKVAVSLFAGCVDAIRSNINTLYCHHSWSYFEELFKTLSLLVIHMCCCPNNTLG